MAKVRIVKKRNILYIYTPTITNSMCAKHKIIAYAIHFLTLAFLCYYPMQTLLKLLRAEGTQWCPTTLTN